MRNRTELETAFGPRLLNLNNGQQGLREGLHPEIHKAAGGEPIIDFIASDETLDRYEEVISAEGWDLSNYRRNPVFLNSHQYGDISFTLGKSIFHEVTNGRLHQRIRFAVEANPVAKLAFGLYGGGYLNAVSVGFIPNDWLAGRPGDPFRRKHVSQELLELSAVSIPANPNALQMGMKSGVVSPGTIADAADFLADFARVARGGSVRREVDVELNEMRRLLRSC